MLEDLLTTINSFIPSGSALGQQLPPEALPLPYLCSVLGALVLGKFTGNLGSLTLLVNAVALFTGAMISTWLLRGIDLPMDHSLHQPLLVSMIGMLAGAFAMMWWLRDDNALA
jgi:hypothetical protein